MTSRSKKKPPGEPHGPRREEEENCLASKHKAIPTFPRNPGNESQNNHKKGCSISYPSDGQKAECVTLPTPGEESDGGERQRAVQPAHLLCRLQAAAANASRPCSLLEKTRYRARLFSALPEAVERGEATRPQGPALGPSPGPPQATGSSLRTLECPSRRRVCPRT